MATANTRTKWPQVALALAVLGGALAWLYREPVGGLAGTAAAFGARTACACRYVAGRGLSDCEKDFEPGMAAVFLTEDSDDRSVTAWVPLLASDTARFRSGYGCLLDRWDG